MKKLLYIAIVGITLIITYGCKKNNRTGEVVQSYKNGEISSDSLLSYLSDSTNYNGVLDWANQHQGDKDFADYILGRAYKFGLGVDSDLIKSKAYYRNAALNGNVNAMSGLGQLYACYPDQEDLDSAYYWFNEAIKNGDAENYFNLVMLENIRKSNEGLPVDTALIVGYLEKGASMNDPKCTTELASLYTTGEGVAMDLKKAFDMLSTFPEDRLDDEGLFLLGQLYESRDVSSPNYNEALRLYRKSANQGNTYAICNIGVYYHFGVCVEQSDSLAFVHYKKSADAGNPCGMRFIGICYMDGIAVKQNADKAWWWYRKAAKNGDTESINLCKQYNVEY